MYHLTAEHLRHLSIRLLSLQNLVQLYLDFPCPLDVLEDRRSVIVCLVQVLPQAFELLHPLHQRAPLPPVQSELHLPLSLI